MLYMNYSIHKLTEKLNNNICFIDRFKQISMAKFYFTDREGFVVCRKVDTSLKFILLCLQH